MPATPASTANPFARNHDCSSSDDLVSSSPVSAHVQMLRFTRLSVEALASTQPKAAVLGSDCAAG
jgi:hypothetical protein